MVFGLKEVKITRGSFPPGSPQKKCGKQSRCGWDTDPRKRRFSPAGKKGRETVELGCLQAKRGVLTG